MLVTRILAFAVLASVGSASASGPSAVNRYCAGGDALQILGSGGPVAEGHRAGTSAVIWKNGKAVLLVDAGSGSFVRYGQSGASFLDHEAILITHFHGDHVSDLSAILNSGGFANRKASLPVIGPEGNGAFPSVGEHLRALFDESTGAFRYLSGFLDGRFGLPKLQPREVDTNINGLQTVHDKPGMRISAISVHHGDVPSLGFLVELDNKKIVFAGDQSFLSEGFVTALKGFKPDILVMHNAIPEGDGQPRGLHRWPESIGAVAAALSPQLLVLSHNMKRALDQNNEGIAAIRLHYRGNMKMADDLDCYGF
ncbi:MAG: MBL fold metallo-hydrolase [Sphingorhabdus sp.]|uniref:MBL fold metallo-hydrolase n=1 Tax=Sphingorhabdus sp. TaxID=1902408 RepID=UPI003C9F47E0